MTLDDRVVEHARAWGVALGESFETATSIVAYGQRGGDPVVLKVLKHPGDEWHCGEVLRAFGGHGMVRVLESLGGAVLLERLVPGNSLVDMALDGRDDEATRILARVIAATSRAKASGAFVTVQELGRAFGRYERAAGGDGPIRNPLLARAGEIYARLVESQKHPRLLHGDLQHSNVLFDARRGWLSIDPKGVVGEVEYEIAAALRNPRERPALFASRATIERRVDTFTSALNVDRDRVIGWAFTQSVLSAIWSVEDGEPVDASNPSLQLAEACYPMIA